jgi:hypothetical protein
VSLTYTGRLNTRSWLSIGQDPKFFPIYVRMQRHALAHVASLPTDCLVWSTRNLVVRRVQPDRGIAIATIAELWSRIREADIDPNVPCENVRGS